MESANRADRRWLVYALGGGLGHLTRAVALARAAIRGQADGAPPRRTEIILLTNSPFASSLPISEELGESHRVVKLPSDLSRDETAGRVLELIRSERFDTLVVDTFPRGLGGELVPLLPELSCRKVLTHRDLSPKYCAQFRLSEFVRHFDRLVVPGEAAPYENFPHAVRTAPWLIRDQHELLSPRAARRRLNVEDDDRPVVAVIGCGRDEEVEQMRCFASQLTSEHADTAAVRLITPQITAAQSTAAGNRRGSDAGLSSPPNLTTVHLWPFFSSILGVSVIVGGGGYNCVHEARATGAKYIGLSWPRLYDRQQRRLRAHERAADFEQARQQVRTAIAARPTPVAASSYRFENGVHEAINAIDAL